MLTRKINDTFTLYFDDDSHVDVVSTCKVTAYDDQRDSKATRYIKSFNLAQVVHKDEESTEHLLGKLGKITTEDLN